MTPLQKLALRASEIRGELAKLAAVDELTDEQRTQVTELRNEYADVETKIQAATVAEDGDAEPEVREQRSEDRELEDLIAGASIGAIFAATLEHRSTDGQTAELQQHLELNSNQVPIELLRETRAVTPAPANVGQNQAEIVPGVFPQSVTAFLGVDTPTVGVGEAVYPVLTTNATVHAPAEAATAAETTGSFTADVLSPSRLQASFFYSREDRARFAGMDSALRQNLSEALADALDKQVVAGTNGLLTGTNLANNASSGEAAFATYLNAAYGRVDGTYASMTSELRLVVGSPTYAHMGSKYRADEDSMNTLDRMNAITGGLRVSAHVPAVASKKQNTIIRRGMRRDMVAPIWEGVTLIPDEVTKASTGEIVVTAVMLHAVKILRAAGFHKQEFQVSA
ncbi:MAG: phage major capsid protein [Rhodospirillales bacterium]|nr:phage major capsid protein [Rhodospirillales bacterium]MCY3701504.1 phage major capsid protein [Rhodospirillales bacterium]